MSYQEIRMKFEDIPRSRGLISSKAKSFSTRTLFPRNIMAEDLVSFDLILGKPSSHARTCSDIVCRPSEMLKSLGCGLIQLRNRKRSCQRESFNRNIRRKGWRISHVGFFDGHDKLLSRSADWAFLDTVLLKEHRRCAVSLERRKVWCFVIDY